MPKIDLDKDLIVTGNIVGEHTITDINVTIQYNQSIRLSPKQVSMSEDLFEDIKRKKILVDPRLYSHSSSKKRKLNKVDTSKSQVSKRNTLERPKSLVLQSPVKNPSPDIEALKFITAGNARSLEELSQMIGLVLMELKNLKSEPKNSSFDPNILREILQQIPQVNQRPDLDLISSPSSTFIPSDLFVGEGNIVATKINIKPEKHEGKRLDDSLEVLKKMRKK